MIAVMRYKDIEGELAPYKELIETIPAEHIQGRKVARICTDRIEELYSMLAEKTERISYLEGELFGKKKNNEPDEESSQPNSADQTANDNGKREKKKRKELDNIRSGSVEKPNKKGTVRTQEARSRVPDGLVCKHCGSAIKDQGLCQKASETDLVQTEVVEREHKLHKGSCDCGAVEFVMPRPDRILDDRPYTASLLAKLVVDKFKFHMPIYRQAKQLEDLGIMISRSVLNDLVLSCWELIRPVADRMVEVNKEQPYRYIDETPICRIVDKKTSKRYYLWGVYTELGVSFVLTEKRNREIAKGIVGSGGTVMTDGLGVYCEETIDGKHANCMSHLLQKLFNAFSSFPDEAEKAIEFIIGIYKIEREANAEGATPEERQNLRQDKSKPLVAELKAYFEELNVPPRSSMGKAIKYGLDRWEKLTLFLTDGNLRLDNNQIESIFKNIKLGMKNSLFVQSDLGGEALAGFNTIIVTCTRYGINPYHYIEDILTRLAGGWPNSRLDELLPWNYEGQELKKLDIHEPTVEIVWEPEELIKRLGLEADVAFVKPTPNPEPPPEHHPPPI